MMMMNSGGCIAAGCIDAQSPVKLSPAKLQQWAEADREFLRAICMNKGSPSCSSPMAAPNNNINVGRQRYLRSYKFSKKETFAQRTKKLWLKVKHDSKVDSDHHHHQEGSAAGRPACSGLIYIFRLYFVCMAKVDVA